MPDDIPIADAPDSPWIWRAGKPLTLDELKAQLALMLRVDSIATLLGSGASKAAGGHTVSEAWIRFGAEYQASSKWLLDHRFVNDETPNVEDLADSLEVARIEWTRAGNPDLPTLSKAIADLRRSVVWAARLDPALWVTAVDGVGATDALKLHRRLLQKLTGSRQPGQPAPWVFTSNYDLAVEWAAETLGLKIINGFEGLHSRRFAPHNFDLGYRNVAARGEARFGTYNVYLAKLHGSLTWRAGEHEVVELPAGSVNADLDRFLAGENDELSGYMVLPSVSKFVRTTGFLYGELLRRLTEFLSRPQVCLVTCGYSFSDEHLNRILMTALQNPTLQMVIYSPELGPTQHGLGRSENRWLQHLLDLESTQVTIVGGGETAHFAAMVDALPDAALHDDHAHRIQEWVRRMPRQVAEGERA